MCTASALGDTGSHYRESDRQKPSIIDLLQTFLNAGKVLKRISPKNATPTPGDEGHGQTGGMHDYHWGVLVAGVICFVGSDTFRYQSPTT